MAKRNTTEAKSFHDTRTKLAHDLVLVAQDTEELIKAAGGEVAEKTREVRERLRQALEDAKDKCAQLEEQAEEGIRAADRVIRDNPYRAIGVAAGVGFLLGCLFKRRS